MAHSRLPSTRVSPENRTSDPATVWSGPKIRRRRRSACACATTSAPCNASALPSGIRTAAAWNRNEWIYNTLEVWKKLCDPIAGRMVGAMSDLVPEEEVAEPTFLADLERLELAMSNRMPHLLTARYYHLVARR